MRLFLKFDLLEDFNEVWGGHVATDEARLLGELEDKPSWIQWITRAAKNSVASRNSSSAASSCS
jgi:hypothetical protein